MSDIENNQSKGSGVFVSEPIYLDIKELESDFYRADIELHNVDHSGPSYEGRVFLNNPNVNEKTPLDLDNGYVGSYNIFGHGGCVGNLGHCNILPPRKPYDKRPAQDLKPQYKRIIITEALKKIGKDVDKFTITIVPVLYGGNFDKEDKVKDLVKVDKVGIILYE